MRELRAVALSEDGGYLVLADAANGRADAEQFRVPVDDRLRAALRGARRSEVRTESALTPREIQARLRAGESAADVARAAGIPVERVERYEGPVLAERARVVQEARAALLPKDPGGGPGRPLGEVVDARLMAGQDNPDIAQWDAWRRVDGIWLVQLTSESRCARWTWDPVVRRVRPHDDAARALVAPEPVDGGAQPAPQAAADLPPSPAPVRQGPPALTLVADPAAERAAPLPEPRPRYAPPASFPAAGYPEQSGAPGGFSQPASPFPARQDPRYTAPRQPAARFPNGAYGPDGPYPGEIPAATGGREDLGRGRPPAPYQDFDREQYPDHYTAEPARYPSAGEPPFAGFPDDPALGEQALAPEPPFAGSAYPDGLAFEDEPADQHQPGYDGFGQPLPPWAQATGQDRAGTATEEYDLGRAYPPAAGRPHRPAAAHRPARPPALEPLPARSADPRRWQERDHVDLDFTDGLDDPADRMEPQTGGRPLPRPATAPPRGAALPPSRPAVPPARPAVSRPGLTPLPSARPAQSPQAAAPPPRPAAPALVPAPAPTSAAPAAEIAAPPPADPAPAYSDEYERVPAAAGEAAGAERYEQASDLGFEPVSDEPADPGEPTVAWSDPVVDNVPADEATAQDDLPEPGPLPEPVTVSDPVLTPPAAPRPALAPPRPGRATAAARRLAEPAADAAAASAAGGTPPRIPAADAAPAARPAPRTRRAGLVAAAAQDTSTAGAGAQDHAKPLETAQTARTPAETDEAASVDVSAEKARPAAGAPAAAEAAVGTADAVPTTADVPETEAPAADAPDVAQAPDVVVETEPTTPEDPDAAAAAEPDVTKRTSATGGNRLAAAAAAAKAGEKVDKPEKSTGKNPDRTPGTPAADGDGPTTGQPSNRPRNTPRTSERSGGGRRGRKSVPAWDDIVFGARRP